MVSRLFQIVYILMDKPYVTAKELSERLDVSERTIYRDLDKLSLAGIPVYTNRGKGGGISLLSDYVIDKMVLTADEKAKIMESLQALSAVGYEDEKQALDKLKNFFGDETQDWIEIDFSDWGENKEESEIFQKLKYSILHFRYIVIQYFGSNMNNTTRRVKPLKLFFRGQAWYLYGYCELRKDYRFFKLRRIREVVIEPEQFKPEKTAKLSELVNNNYGKNQKTIRVTVEIQKEMAFRAYDELSDITEKDDKTLVCVIMVTDIEWFIGYVFSYGTYMKVVQPQEVKDAIKQRISEIGSIYFKNT